MASSLSKVEAMRTSPRWSLDFDPKSGAAPVFFVCEICYGFLMDMFSSMGIFFFVGFLYWFIFMDVLNGVCLFVRLYVVCLKRRREGIAWRPDVSWSSWCLKLGIGVVDVAAVFGCCCWLDQHTRIYIHIQMCIWNEFNSFFSVPSTSKWCYMIRLLPTDDVNSPATRFGRSSIMTLWFSNLIFFKWCGWKNGTSRQVRVIRNRLDTCKSVFLHKYARGRVHF